MLKLQIMKPTWHGGEIVHPNLAEGCVWTEGKDIQAAMRAAALINLQPS